MVGTAVMTALFPLKRSMHLLPACVYDHHHIEKQEECSSRRTWCGKFRETPQVPNPVRIRQGLDLSEGVATCAGKEYREPRQCHA